eukprot:14843180-Alexandrium_andersonii.AAC.1
MPQSVQSSCRPSRRVSGASGPDPSSPELRGAPRSPAELVGPLQSSPILEHAKLRQSKLELRGPRNDLNICPRSFGR